MSLLHSDSADHYSDITLKYSSDSTAVITPGAGRKGTAGIVTNGTTFFTLDRVALNEDIASLTLVRGIAMDLDSLPGSTQTILQFQEADNTDQVCIGLLSTGTVRAFRGNTGGSTLASSAFPLSAGIYYFIDTKVFIDNVAGTVEVRIWPAPERSIGSASIPDSSDVVTAPAAMFTSADLGRRIVFGAFESHVIAINSSMEVQVADTNSSGNTISGSGTLSYIPAIDFTGDTQNAGTGTLGKIKHGLGLSASWDDGYLCDDQGGAFDDFLGNRSVRALLPVDAGFYTTWGPTPGPPNYANAAENPPNESDYNSAPITNPSSSPSFVAEAHSFNSYECDIPAGDIGDILIAVLRTSAVSNGDSLPDIARDSFWSSGRVGPTGQLDGVGAGVNMTFPFDLGAPVLTTWEGQVFSRRVDGTEPATYTFQYSTAVDNPPRIAPLEITILRFTGVNQAISVEDNTFDTSQVRGTTLSFLSVDAFTDNDLIVAVEITEDQQPSSPSGYTANYAGSRINVSSKLKSPPGGEVPPNTTLAAADSWGTNAFSLKANAQLATGDKDTFLMPSPPANDAFMVNLMADQVDGTGHSVGAATRHGEVDNDSAAGVEPDSDFKFYQFPFEEEFDPNGEAGYALDTPTPPPPPEEAVVFWVDADDLDATFNDGDPITSIVETGIHGYTLSPARSVAGDHVLQTFETSVAAINNQDSIEGITESLACTPATRSIGYFNGATDSDLFLGDAFTLVCVFNLTQFDGCWQTGEPHIIFRRGTDAGLDFAGWALRVSRTSGGDPGATGSVLFERYNSSLSPIVTVFSPNDSIVEGQTYLVSVICDDVAGTVRLRLDGVEVDTAANVAEIEPAANDLWFLTSGLTGGNSQNPPQGQVPYIKIWNIELEPADLTAEESALMTKYGI